MKKTLSVFAILFVTFTLTVPTVLAAPPEHVTGDMFLCPSVSPNNSNGIWVIGGTGAYYITFPGLSSPNWNMPDNLNPFAAVEDNPADV